VLTLLGSPDQPFGGQGFLFVGHAMARMSPGLKILVLSQTVWTVPHCTGTSPSRPCREAPLMHMMDGRKAAVASEHT
jgi:hypothetical protein